MNANNHKNKLTNLVKAQQPPLTGYPSQIQNNLAYSRGGKKKCQMKRNKVFNCISRSNLPCCMEPETSHVDSLLQLPSNGSAGVILGNFKWKILRTSGPSCCQSCTYHKAQAPIFLSAQSISPLSLDLSHQLEALSQVRFS